MSTFVWLDYSERERPKILDVVDLFRERDELGDGLARDAFADVHATTHVRRREAFHACLQPRRAEPRGIPPEPDMRTRT